MHARAQGQDSCTEHYNKLPVAVHNPPLAFDLATDPGQTTPIKLPADVLAAVTAARDAKNADIESTFRTTINWAGGGRGSWACCDASMPDCGCRSR
jgi:hypothetical protein